jgi:N-acetylmuramoyl-L-alanine amidase
MRRNLPFISLVIALVLASGAVSAADLQDMKLLEDDAGTRAVLSLQGASDYKMFTLHNPDRLVLDLSQTRLAPGFRLPPANGAIANVRTGQPAPGTLRVVFDLGSSVASRSRVEREGTQSRLIVELTGLEHKNAEQVFARAAGVDTSPVAEPPIAAPPVVALPAPTPGTLAVVESPAQSIQVPIQTPVQTPIQTETVAQPARAPAKTVRDVIGSGQRKLVVAIDAGHGGKDPGAHGPTGVREKAVTLAVARELASQINADPGMRAVLIRDGDSFVPLKERYMKARAAQADLFISIHADASPNNTASGASVFVLSTRGASSQAARWLADTENAADLVGGVSLDEKDHNLAAVLLDLSQSATMRASDDLANQVLGSLKSVGKAHKQSIERANFVVLRSPDVPSMLIETGFITNPGEEQHLNDAGYRARLASAIADGVRRYFIGQPPAGSWYASRQTESAPGAGMGSSALAASPE